MKLALLATLLAFGGSIAGFGLTAGADAPDPRTTASPPSAESEQIVVRGTDRDCPKAQAAERT
jgi:hypothetical protein